MIPLDDDNPATGLPVVTHAVTVLCVVVFLWQLTWSPSEPARVAGLGFVPGALFGAVPAPAGILALPPPATLVSYLFLHGTWWHLIGNLVFLWVFGRSLERVLGSGIYAVLLIGGGVAAALAQAAVDPASAAAVIGISGATSALLGAYLVRFPGAEVRVLVPLIVVMQVVRLPAWLLLLAWLGYQVVLDWATPLDSTSIAFRAHVGGFVAGALAMLVGRPFLREPANPSVPA